MRFLDATGHCHQGLLCGLKTLEAIAEVVLGELDVVFPVRRRVLSWVGLVTGLARQELVRTGLVLFRGAHIIAPRIRAYELMVD
jgi:hypothetical protein